MKLSVLPGYFTSVCELERGTRLLLDVSHKVLLVAVVVVVVVVVVTVVLVAVVV